MFLMAPGLVLEKWDVKNTKKVLTSSVSLPQDPARLWPSDDDARDDGKDGDAMIARILRE